MHDDFAGMIPNAANPYQRDTSHVPPRVESPAATLTVADLDELVRSRIALERRVWAEETRRECERAWEKGRHYGMGEGTAAEHTWLTDKITDVIRRQLNHSARKLKERERQATTIKAERAFMNGVGNEIERAIQTLRAIDGVDR